MAVVVVPLVVAVALVAMARRETHDPYDRTTGTYRVEAVVDVAGLATRICRCRPDRTIDLEYAGFTTRADLYGVDRAAPTLGLVLIHGNTARGRRLATYRALATRLADRGAAVMAFDQLGFGDSDDPFGRGPEAARRAYDRTALATAAVRLLVEEVPEVAGRIVVVGHSGGALPGLRLAFEHPAVAAAALIGPPRRVEERSDDVGDVAYFAERFRETYRWVYGHDLPEWLSPEHLAAEGPYSLEEHLDWPGSAGLAEAGHVPVLFVDGGREDPVELAYLDAFLERVVEPRDQLRQMRANHYLNCAESLGWVVYDAPLVDELAVAIVDFAERWLGD